MPEMLGCTFDVRSAEFTKFIDNSENITLLNKMNVRMGTHPRWSLMPGQELATLSLGFTFQDKFSKYMILDLTLKIEFNLRAPEGVPIDVWRALAAIAWGHIAVQLSIQSTPIGGINVPTPNLDDLIPKDSLRGFSMN